MANSNNDAVEHKLEGIEHALTRTEQYIEDNRKSLSIIAGAIIAAVAIYFAFNQFYLKPQEAEAQKQMYVAEQYFEKDSLKQALNGDGNYPGFLGIIDQYSLTDAANLAHYYAGICYKNMGKYNEAIEYLKKFDSNDVVVSNIALGSIGDCYAELGDTDKALKFYKKAAENKKNDFTSPLYLMRAGLLLEDKNEFSKALEMYQRIEKEYNKSYEGQQVEKYITRVKVKGNIK
ncbi:MAG: tetratricopeptide repeat protein [Bacteroidota bacterium]|nr:tetratricopeptide repeat protein [Bacteroidota bacterium]